MIEAEKERIRSVYADRDEVGRRELYAWHRPEVRQQDTERERVTAALLVKTVGPDLSNIRVLDVGCGTGGFLRTLVEWGAHPENLVGTEFLKDRLEKAQQCSAPGIRWHLGGLDSAECKSFDLVVTNTVFSSILNEAARAALANEMWRVLKPGGWVMVFDFRYNNPSNPNVRKVRRCELRRYWQSSIGEYYKTMLLAPPIARAMSPKFYLLGELLSWTLPFLRSHFLYMAKKG